jgi:hypothetical protein
LGSLRGELATLPDQDEAQLAVTNLLKIQRQGQSCAVGGRSLAAARLGSLLFT